MLKYSFTLDERSVEARVYPDGIEFSFLSSKRAKAFAERLVEEESERLGLPLQDRVEEHVNGRTLVMTPELDGLPMDHHTRTAEGSLPLFGVWSNGNIVHLSSPMQEIRVSETISADSLLRPEEVRETLLFLNTFEFDSGLKIVTVYQSCQPVYRADVQTGTLRPAWRVCGKQYVYNPISGSSETLPHELLVDALTGEAFLTEGTDGSM